MNLSDYLAPDRVVVLAGATKSDALEELCRLLAGRTDGLELPELLASVWEREEMMSTGIGQGLAIPHVRMPSLKRPAMAVGVSRAGLHDYESLDGMPVHVVLMIVAPQGQHETHIRLLALVANKLKEKHLRQAVIESEDPARVHALLTEEAS